jgi:hypothetical protein
LRATTTKHTTIPAQARAAILGDYRSLSDRELADELTGLQTDLVQCHRFGRVAAKALQAHCLARLADVAGEFQRRTSTVVFAPLRPEAASSHTPAVPA